jgi:hypothetical protein
MSQAYSRFCAAIIAAVFLMSVGCSAKYNQSLIKKDPALLGPIKVVRLETPGILKSSGAEAGFLALATVAVPGGSALLLVGDAYGKARGADSQNMIPDFGAVVMEKFLKGIPKAEPTWPQLTVVSAPIKEPIIEQSTVIEFDVKRLAYGSIDLARGGIAFEHGLDKGLIVDGFLSKTVVTMKAPDGEVIWQKSYLYLSQDYDREMSLDVLEANNFDLLKEEMLFAAEQTAQDFLNHLNGKAN